MRLCNLRTHDTTTRRLNVRVFQGVQATSFTDLGVDANLLSYSLQLVDHQPFVGYHWLLNVLFKQQMMGPDRIYKRVIVTAMFMKNGYPMTHAFTCISHNNG